MAIEQVMLEVGSDWVKVSTGDCLVQVYNSAANSIEFAISEDEPANTVMGFVTDFTQPKTIGALDSNVWLRQKQAKVTPGITVSQSTSYVVVSREEL